MRRSFLVGAAVILTVAVTVAGGSSLATGQATATNQAPGAMLLVCNGSTARYPTIPRAAGPYYRTVQGAVDVGRPGDWILIYPGVYDEKSAWKASGVTIQNLTVCDYLAGPSGHGNEIWWDGGDGSGTIGLGSFSGSYLTTTSQYAPANLDSQNLAQYRIVAGNTHGPGSSRTPMPATWRTGPSTWARAARSATPAFRGTRSAPDRLVPLEGAAEHDLVPGRRPTSAAHYANAREE